MNQIISKTNNKYLVINLIFSLIPLSLIIGTLALNLNIILFIVINLIFFSKKIFIQKYSNIDKLVIVFFFFILFTGVFNTIENYYFGDGVYLYAPGVPMAGDENYDFTILIKTIAYMRYLLIYLILKFLIEKNYLKFNWFFFSSSFFCMFVCLDVIFQFFVGVDIFGFKSPTPRKLSGPFHDELIAGSYIQRFSLFLFFLFPIFLKNNNKTISYLLLFFIFSLILISILLSGNRIPLVLFMVTMLLIMITEKELQKFILFTFLILSIVFTTLFFGNKEVNINYKHFYRQTTTILKVINPVNLFRDYKIDRTYLPDHFDEFESFYDTWHMNKYIGGGVRAFRLNCPKRKNIYVGPNPRISERGTCNTHPHNYYLEILTELGLIGLLIIILIVSKIIWFYIFRNSLFKNYIIPRKIEIPFFMLFFAEIFPFKSSGSFFTSLNATFIFIVLAVTAALINKRKT
jgi:O-antigen ligase|tara:strand:- start:949 stop:2328 length:1380 start_codon:yes stop_codon:yes gene_type:complete